MAKKLICDKCGCKEFYIHSNVHFTLSFVPGYSVYRCSKCGNLMKVEMGQTKESPSEVEINQ